MRDIFEHVLLSPSLLRCMRGQYFWDRWRCLSLWHSAARSLNNRRSVDTVRLEGLPIEFELS